MTPDLEPPIDPSVRRLIAGIAEMANQVRQPFVPDPDQVRIFNAAYSQSKKQAREEMRPQHRRAAE
jgi:hypothetical protein